MNQATLSPSNSIERRERLQRVRGEIHDQLVARIDMSALRNIKPELMREQLRLGAQELCRFHSDLLTHAEQEEIVEDLLYEMLGLGPIEVLMNDPTISDILINGPSSVFVERRGMLEETQVRFQSLDHLVNIVQRVASRVGRRIDESSPMVDARLPDGSRLNAVIRPLALEGALVSIRKFATRPMTAADFVKRRVATPEMLGFLAACIAAKLNIVISGGTGSGKTTLLNMLSSHIPKGERIATIEDAAELQLQQSHVARMETRPANLEGRGEVTASDLLKNALRMRPDRIIIGECRGVEAFDMLQAMSTGHAGSMTTIHSNDTRDAINRLEMLVGMAAPELPMWFVHRQIASSINIVIQTHRMAGGTRKITQISEITGTQNDAINMHDLFTFQQTGVGENGQVEGHFEASGIMPKCLPRLRSAGVHIDADMFRQRRMEVDIDQMQEYRIQ
ncbi:Putative conjugal transfer protein [Rosistilla oblonga]|uniref:Conjugal transfer protein n=1 Tax=Rosistilla oblonga TaxID=2527990 RepID=A0A518ILV3_9BACT|nr:CpaF family protein [Rosistilla oblonga]QDV10183.1 Putative conjugal transfer protein [Rosistilla oblonga]QDV54080.1 Putative conjugal transfer protein [Rosistilla oblonga]